MFFVCDLMLELDGKRVVALLAFITREGLEYCVERWEKERKLSGEVVVACGGGKMGRVGSVGGGMTIGGDAVMVCICLLL